LSNDTREVSRRVYRTQSLTRMTDTILFERRGPVDWVTINRPTALNALTIEMRKRLCVYFHDLRHTATAARVVILRSAGDRAFSAGLDIKEAAVQRLAATEEVIAAESFRVNQEFSDIVRAMRACPQPIIACINGIASGGGFALALGADIRLATVGAKMNSMSLLIGTSGCDLGISYFLPRMVGLSIASELMLTGRFIDGHRAERVGLVSTAYSGVVEMEAAAAELAADMLQNASALALELTKQGIALAVDSPSLEATLALEDRQQALLVASPSMLQALQVRMSGTHGRSRL
jgi:enoyl-CoA hydratase/carnithine racemase